MSINDSMYYYIKNLQGDITKIVNHQGKVMVEYTYDAWGNILKEKSNVTPSYATVKAFNPFRYRGYVYDTDTGLYYLQSRYYDPKTGRFINADDTAYIGSSGTVLSCNIFVYCENNPINLYYYTGNCSYLDGEIIKTCNKSNKYNRDNAIKYAEKSSDDYSMQFPKFQNSVIPNIGLLQANNIHILEDQNM